MTDPGTVVYDLDGTLVRLAVEWDAVRAEVRELYREAGVAGNHSLWDMMARAPEHGLQDPVETAIRRHEEAGARNSDRLTVADELLAADQPAGVCSLNAESACRIALDTHDLLSSVDAVIGRDSVDAHKPDPTPLLAVIDALDATPEQTLFVGDSERDQETAKRAGTAFAWAEDYARRRA